MNSETRQALILATAWLALSIIALIGLETREAVIFSIAAAIILVGVHFVLLWSLDSTKSREHGVIASPDIDSNHAAAVDTTKSRLTEKRLSHLAELADVGLVQASAGGEIEFASRRARELLDLDASLAPSEGWSQAFDALRAHFSPDSTSTGAVQIFTTEGPTTLSLKAHPVHEDGWDGYLVQVRDRKTLDALESDLRLASRLRVLNRLYLGVAHDLKGPLNAIMLTLEGLHADIEDGSADAKYQLDRLDVIRDELGRHHRALETVLAQTAPERLERSTFDLRAVVDHVARLIRPQLRQQKIELEVEGDTPAPVFAIHDRIRETLLAMAVNAMEAMPDGGKLSIITSCRNDFCTIDMKDTGDGIPDEIVHQIFELRFSTKDTGTGIGLSTARSIVESEHGTIEMIDTGSDGTTFRINLPVAPNQ